jgi:AbrB family looped-hinge helix DNA binding protein
MIETIIINAKGQVTIPAQMRKALDIKAGQEILCERTSEGKLLLRPKKSIFELLDNFHANRKGKKKKPLAVEDMDAAVGKAIADNYAAKFGKKKK